MTTIISKVLGTLTLDPHFDNWWHAADIAIPFLRGQNLPVVYTFYPDKDVSFLWEADEAIRHFLTLGEAERNAAAVYVHKNCRDYLHAVGWDEDPDEPMSAITDPTAIWPLVHPYGIWVQRRSRRDRDVYVQISCRCDWEIEHGLQLVFRRGRQLTRVSSHDGHLTEADAYDKPDAEDALLSRFVP